MESITSGLIYPRERPRYLFRGECGEFDTTMDSARRLQAEVLKGEFPLSNMDVVQLGKLIVWLAARLCVCLHGLDRAGAVALLQHYGLPSRVVDLTGDLRVAFTFAAMGQYSIGRVAVVPYPARQIVRVLELFDHAWAERAQRQAAYGVVMTDQLADPKSEVARSLLNIKWYEVSKRKTLSCFIAAPRLCRGLTKTQRPSTRVGIGHPLTMTTTVASG